MPIWEKSSPAGVKDSGGGGASVRVCRSRRVGAGRGCGTALKRRDGPADTSYRMRVCVETVPKIQGRDLQRLSLTNLTLVVRLNQTILFVIVV